MQKRDLGKLTISLTVLTIYGIKMGPKVGPGPQKNNPRAKKSFIIPFRVLHVVDLGPKKSVLIDTRIYWKHRSRKGNIVDLSVSLAYGGTQRMLGE